MFTQNQSIVVCIKRDSSDPVGYFYITTNPRSVIEHHCRELLLMNTQYHAPMLAHEDVAHQLVLYPNYLPVGSQAANLTLYLNEL